MATIPFPLPHFLEKQADGLSEERQNGIVLRTLPPSLPIVTTMTLRLRSHEQLINITVYGNATVVKEKGPKLAANAAHSVKQRKALEILSAVVGK